MKKRYIFILTAVILLSGCTGRESAEREPMPTLETVPPRSATSPAYTGTTTDYYRTAATSAPRMGDEAGRGGGNNSPLERETADTSDRDYFNEDRETDTADNIRDFTETGDTADRREEPRDTSDTRDINY